MTTNNKITTNTQEMMMSYGHNSNPEMTLSTTRNPSPPRCLSRRQQEQQELQQRQTVVRLPSVVKLFLAGQQGTVFVFLCVCEKKICVHLFLFSFCNVQSFIIITTQIHFYYYSYNFFIRQVQMSSYSSGSITM